jgi:uncharacterized membrane protein YoaK (UPF0700 family)
MLRTVFTIGLLAFVGLFALKLVFGILGGLFGLFFGLLALAIPVAIVGALIYVALLIFAPETARGVREKFGGN